MQTFTFYVWNRPIPYACLVLFVPVPNGDLVSLQQYSSPSPAILRRFVFSFLLRSQWLAMLALCGQKTDRLATCHRFIQSWLCFTFAHHRPPSLPMPELSARPWHHGKDAVSLFRCRQHTAAWCAHPSAHVLMPGSVAYRPATNTPSCFWFR